MEKLYDVYYEPYGDRITKICGPVTLREAFDTFHRTAFGDYEIKNINGKCQMWSRGIYGRSARDYTYMYTVNSAKEADVWKQYIGTTMNGCTIKECDGIFKIDCKNAQKVISAMSEIPKKSMHVAIKAILAILEAFKA